MQSGSDVIWLEITFNIINFGTILSFVKFGDMLFGKKREDFEKNDNYSNSILIILGTLCFLTGILGSPFLYLLFGEWFIIDVWGYLLKTGIWIISFALAWVFYKKVISQSNMRENTFTNISFNGMAIGMVLLFVVIMSAGFILYS